VSTVCSSIRLSDPIQLAVAAAAAPYRRRLIAISLANSFCDFVLLLFCYFKSKLTADFLPLPPRIAIENFN
jgi:hypothetical protein